MPVSLYGTHTNDSFMSMEGMSLSEILPKHQVILDNDNRANCPFHDDSDRSFHYGPSDDTFWCDFCGAEGKAVQFVMHYYNIDFRSALSRFGMRKTPTQVQEQRWNAELARRSNIAPPPPDEARIANELNERIDKLQIMLGNMDACIQFTRERVNLGENHQGLSPREAAAIEESKYIKRLLERHDKHMQTRGVIFASTHQKTYDDFIIRHKHWLTYTPPTAR